MHSEVVVSAFNQVFKDSRPYGKNVYIIGKDPINRAMKRNILQYYLEYKNEIPHLAFDYMGEEMKEGFVITNFRLVWHYSDGSDHYDVDLEDIQRVEAGRSVLARVMQITDVTGKKYPKIYLTGMDAIDIFVQQLNEFVAVMNGVDDEDVSDWPVYEDEQNYNRTPVTRSQPQERVANADALANFIVQTFARREFMFDRYIYPFGRDDKSNEKIAKAVNAYANLKGGEVPLVCCDITAFGGAEDGLLITDKGIYVHNSFDNVQYFPYESISSIELKGFLSKDIYINGFKIESPAGFDNSEKQNFAALLQHFMNNLGN